MKDYRNRPNSCMYARDKKTSKERKNILQTV